MKFINPNLWRNCIINNIYIRQADEKDRKCIASIFAEAFYSDWKSLDSDIEKISLALEKGINIAYYSVAILDNEIIGFISVITGNYRAFTIPINEFKKQFGYFKGFMAGMAIRNDFEAKLNLSVNECYIDILGVKKEYMRNGVATALILYLIEQVKDKEYIISVTDVNVAAISCYKKLAFKIYKEEKVKYSKQRGFSKYIYLRYTK
ncbi:MAG: GNAT family N-acetyltransferase [Sarcina sp.]